MKLLIAGRSVTGGLTGGTSGSRIGPVKESSGPSPDVTTLLRAWSAGDPGARDQVVTLVYRDLHRRAVVYLRRERRDHTLQPTALVHEAYVRLTDQKRIEWRNRAQFLGVASEMMRRILVDHARRGRMAKRSGRLIQVELDDRVVGALPPSIDVLMLDQALTRLAEFDGRKSRIAELRFFGGLSLDEMAQVMDISVATVERDWQTARARLYSALKGERPR